MFPVLAGHPPKPPHAGSPAPSLRRAFFALLALSGALLAGCAVPADARKDANFQSYASVADRPTQRPGRSLSSFSDALSCMDRMLREAELPTTLVASKTIPDFSGKVPVATKDMVITALSQMSRRSNAFRYVDYEVNIVQQDTVQNLTTILLNNNQLQLQRPALYVSGAIAFVDQNIINNRFDAGVTASRLEAGYSQNRAATVIGLEMHLGDFRTRTLIPGMDSSNEVVIANGGHGLDLAGRIGSYGVQFNVGRDYTQGSGAAVRTLVDLAMIELVGKWAHLPYWQCLTLNQTHPGFQRQLRDWYDEGDPATRDRLVRRSLVSQGYLQPQAEMSDANDPGVRAAIARFQADNDTTVSGTVDFPTYERALRDFVGLDKLGNLERVGWSPDRAAQRTADVSLQAAASITGPPSATVPFAGLGAAPPPRAMSLQMESLLLERAAFEQGEQVFLSLTVSRSSYLACYMADAQGAVMRLLPNLSSSRMQVPGNRAVRIPDWMSPNPGFVMDAGAPGTEEALCVATDTDVLARLPAPLGGPALTPMVGVAGIAAVKRAYTDLLGEQGYTAATLQWQVVARRTPAAAPPTATSPAK